MNEKINRLLAYIISSSIGCLKEPKIYGPLRLIDTTEKLIKLFIEQGYIKGEKYIELADIINEGKYSCMDDELEFEQMLNKASKKLLEIMDKKGD